MQQNEDHLHLSSIAFRWTSLALVSTVWLSSAIFGLYILAFYAAALWQGDLQRWNGVLPDLYTPGAAASNTGIGLHFAAGGIILLLGSTQLIAPLRERYPAFHRLVGRVYLFASLFAGLGGLTFILLKGTIGGRVMSVGFGLYGALMVIAALQTMRHARARRLDEHRAWALRLYALAIGSWLYRMDYGFWLLFMGKLGHGDNFSGPFDHFMDFFFYLPNLLVAEVFIRAGHRQSATWVRVSSSILLLSVTAFLLLGTYFFTFYYWGPAIQTYLFQQR